MLILRRKVGEKIVIGDGIVVVVSRVAGGRVTLGIEAPSDVHIVRGELLALDDKPRPATSALALNAGSMHVGEPAHLVVSLAGGGTPLPR